MRNMGLVSLMILLLLAASASGQKGQTPPSDAVAQDDSIVIEDDETANFLVINPHTGDYKFYRCSDGYTLLGTGEMSVSGCQVNFQDLAPGRRVLATVDECALVGKGTVELYPRVRGSGNDELSSKNPITDSNMRDDTMSCRPSKTD